MAFNVFMGTAMGCWIEDVLRIAKQEMSLLNKIGHEAFLVLAAFGISTLYFISVDLENVAAILPIFGLMIGISVVSIAGIITRQGRIRDTVFYVAILAFGASVLFLVTVAAVNNIQQMWPEHGVRIYFKYLAIGLVAGAASGTIEYALVKFGSGLRYLKSILIPAKS